MSSSSSEIETSSYINLPSLFFKSLRFIKKSFKKLFISLILINIISFYYYSFLYTPKFKSNMVAFSQIYQIEDISVLIRGLNNLVESRSYEELAKVLQMEVEQVKSIKRFNVTLLEFSKTDKEKSTDKQEEKFDIQVTVSDNLILNKLNIGFTQYILKNDFLKLQSKIRLDQLVNLRNKIVGELKSLDSLKRGNLTGYNLKNDKASLLLYSPGDMYETIIKLYDRQIDVEFKINLGTEFKIIQGFSNDVPNTNVVIYNFLILVNLVSSILLLIVFGIIDLSKRYNNV